MLIAGARCGSRSCLKVIRYSILATSVSINIESSFVPRTLPISEGIKTCRMEKGELTSHLEK
jgi:hypothetical protein